MDLISRGGGVCRRDARRDVIRRAYQAEKFLSSRRTHLLQIDGNDGSNSGLDEFFTLAHALYTRVHKYIYLRTRTPIRVLLAKYIIRGEWTVNAVI